MNRTATILTFLCFTLGASAQGLDFSRLHNGMPVREVPQPTLSNRSLTPSELAIRQAENSQQSDATSKSAFRDWMLTSPEQGRGTQLSLELSDIKYEKMDSVVRTYSNGQLASKQVFEYNKAGLPLRCNNFVPDATTGQLKNVGFYSYEYDDLGRMLARDVIDESGSVTSQRFEYIYSDESLYYTQMIFFLRENDEWIPYQMADYAYDAHANTTEQIYSQYDNTAQEWTPVQRTTASYDDQDRITSYFEWIWNARKGQWAGNTSPQHQSQTFTYTPAGQDQLISTFIWEKNAWLEYQHSLFIYDDNGLLTENEITFWNRNNQDWSGFDKYGPAAQMEVNYTIKYQYDDKLREVSQDVFDAQKDGTFICTWRRTHDWTDFGDGNVERIEKDFARWTDSHQLEVQTEIIQQFNAFGSETYYKKYSYATIEGKKTAHTEEIRHIDKYNRFHGAEYYDFTFDEQNRRYGVIKEQYEFDDNVAPAVGVDHPIHGHHWSGSFSDDTSWSDVADYEYDWSDNGVLLRRSVYGYYEGKRVPMLQGVMEYDFNQPIEYINMWYIAHQSADFYRYKTLSIEAYNNADYAQGDDQWDADASYRDVFYYSEAVQDTGISPVFPILSPLSSERTYDLTGRRLTAPGKGFNIIRHPNGENVIVIIK